MLKKWILILRTCNTDDDFKNLDPVSWWLIITRACVFVMTILSGILGGIYVLEHGHINWANFIIVIIGLILAHGSNNLVNDYYDVKLKVDSLGYVREEYAPHPLLSGLISEKGLILLTIVMDIIDFFIALYLSINVGWLVMVFAVIGLAISVFYVAPPLKFKYRGLGELAIFFIWGPLIIGGTIYAAGGTLDWNAWLFTIPYGLAVTAVVVGKHLDKLDKDAKRGVRTLPVILGKEKGLLLMKILVTGFYITIFILPFTGATGWWVILSLGSIPWAIRLFKTLNSHTPRDKYEAFQLAEDVIPKDLKEKYSPEDPNFEVPLWPLWYVAWGVWWVRVAGSFLIASLIIDIIFK